MTLFQVLLYLAIIVQFVAMYYAVRLVRATKYNSIWILFIIGFMLLAGERLLQLLGSYGNPIPSESLAWLDIIISVSISVGVVLLDKLIKATKKTGIKDVAIAGGVSANSGLREAVAEAGRRRGWRTFIPELKFTTDNAAMIAISGYYRYQQGMLSSYDIAPVARLEDIL